MPIHACKLKAGVLLMAEVPIYRRQRTLYFEKTLPKGHHWSLTAGQKRCSNLALSPQLIENHRGQDISRACGSSPIVGICRPSNPLPAKTLKAAGHMGGSIYIRGHSAGSYAGMVWETILAEFPNIEGRTVLTAIAFPPALLTRSVLSYNRQVHLIHHADDRLCIWNPSRHDMRLLQQQRFKITHVTGWRAYWECTTQLCTLDACQST